MSPFLQDLRFSARSLIRQPGFALAAVLTLALGIGANTAIFSIVDSVLLTPPPFEEPERVAMIWAVNPDIAKLLGFDDLPVSAANLYDWQEQSTSFDGLALAQQDRMALTGQGDPEQLGVVRVTPDFFEILGTPALVGRTLGPEDEIPGTPLGAVLSHSYWKRRFGGDPNVVGRKFVLNGTPLNVVGIMPPRFAFPRGSELPSYLGFAVDPDAWVPRAHPVDKRQDRGNRVSFMIGRLKPGVSIETAEAELNAISERIGEEFPRTDKGWAVRLLPVTEQMVQGLRPVLLVLWTAVALVLLIACVNVANLLLARAASRQKEIAVRTAIGAGRRRLASQLLVESAMLSLAGGVAGIFLAWGFLRICASAVPTGLAGAATFSLDGRTLLFTLGVCALATLLAGLFPVFQMTRPDLAESLREGTRAGAGNSQSRRTRSALVVAEVAIAVVVLIGAGLLLRSFGHLLGVDPGFQVANVLSFKTDLPADRPKEELASFYNRLDEELRSMPGVVSAGIISDLPMGSGDNVVPVVIEGKPEPEPGQMLLASVRMVTPGYFAAMGLELDRSDGRLLQAGDGVETVQVAVIDKAMSETYWPGEDPIGKRFKRLDAKEPPWVTVIGVVGDVRHSNLYSEPRPTIYMTPSQTTRYFMPYQASAVIRTEGSPMAIVPAVRKAVYAVDKDQPLSQIRPLEEVVGQSISKNRLSLLILSLLAILSLLLAVVGIFGITSYSVAQRTREIGLRMALGARPAEVLRLIVRETGLLAGLGIAVGIALAFALTRLASAYVSSLLFGVSSTDPVTFVGVALVLALVALGAAYLPGRRATRVSPNVALRAD